MEFQLIQFKNSRLGLLVKREKKVIAYVKSTKKTVRCFFNNPARLEGIVKPGVSVIWLEHKRAKTQGRVLAVNFRNRWLFIDTNILHHNAMRVILSKYLIGSLPRYLYFDSEVKIDHSRIDYVLRNDKKYLLEVKGCFRFIGDCAFFPDTVSERSTKHMQLLKKYAEQGVPGIVVFVSPIPVRRIGISWDIDPKFYQALIDAVSCGVKVVGIALEFDGESLYYRGEVDVDLSKDILIKCQKRNQLL